MIKNIKNNKRKRQLMNYNLIRLAVKKYQMLNKLKTFNNKFKK